MKRIALITAALISVVGFVAPAKADSHQSEASSLVLAQEDTASQLEQDTAQLDSLANRINQNLSAGELRIRPIPDAEDAGLPNNTVVINSDGEPAVGLDLLQAD